MRYGAKGGREALNTAALRRERHPPRSAERSCGRGSSERLFYHGLEAMVAQGARLFEGESNVRELHIIHAGIRPLPVAVRVRGQ